MRRLAIVPLAALLLAGRAPAAERTPLAENAERSFFHALNDAPQAAAGARDALTAAYATDPSDGRTAVLLGLAHLWAATEAAPRDLRAIEHLYLSERFLSRAQELDPKEERIPSWLVPVRLSLAGLERRPERAGELIETLRAAYRKDPSFHSFSIALVNVSAAPGSPRFQEGLEALRKALASRCRDEGESACRNAPRVPHNVEGFALFAAEYEARAGNLPRAADLLDALKTEPTFAAWPFKAEAEELHAAVEAARHDVSARPALDARALSFGREKRISCLLCHGGAR